jgi:NADPH:quinone reductase-like Zn-dependent oxidoreductase
VDIAMRRDTPTVSAPEIRCGDSTMRALVFDRFGPPAEVLALKDVPAPVARSGEALVRMKLVPINPSDLMTVRGLYGRLPGIPATPGFEGCGVVEKATGLLATLRGLRPGRRVAVLNPAGGNWAERVVVPARQLVPVPDDVPDEQVAMFFVNPATVLAMVERVLRVPRGAWLLQTAAASALGKMIVKLGRLRGFRTLNLVRSPESAEALRRLGAEAVVVTSTDTVAARIDELTAGKKAAFALDCVGGDMGRLAVEGLAAGGRMLVYGALSGESIPLAPRALIGGQKSIAGFWLSEWARSQGPLAMLGLFREITQLLRAGVLTSEIEAVYAMEQFGPAVEHASRPGRTGKVLLRMEASRES